MLIAGFVAGGTDDVDANQETVRLLRSQLRSKSSLRVIDADVMALREVAQDQNKSASAPEAVRRFGAGRTSSSARRSRCRCRDEIKNEKDLEAYERLFANTAYWQRIGEEYQNPLIVTGTVLFAPQQRAGWVSRDVEQFDSFGRRRVVPIRNYIDRKGFMLRAEVRLHRRPHRRDALPRAVPRRGPLPRAAEHARAVVVLRADGSPGAELPERAEQPEDPRHARPAQVAPSGNQYLVVE